VAFWHDFSLDEPAIAQKYSDQETARFPYLIKINYHFVGEGFEYIVNDKYNTSSNGASLTFGRGDGEGNVLLMRTGMDPKAQIHRKRERG